MRKLAVVMILILLVIAFYSNKSFQAQDYSQPTVNQRIKMIENNLTKAHKVYKVIGENDVKANGKIIQKISSLESFEILAMPLVEPQDEVLYDQKFIGRLYADNGLQLSEVKSDLGIRVDTKIPEGQETKTTHKFEFINPNANDVKVRFYFVQDKL